MNLNSYVLISATQQKKLISVSHIREIVPLMAIETGARRSRFFRGLINLRGEIIPVFDLEEGPVRFSPDRFILISDSEDGQPMGLIVDDVFDIVSVSPQDVVNRSLGEGRREVFTLIDDVLVSVFDPRTILHDNR